MRGGPRAAPRPPRDVPRRGHLRIDRPESGGGPWPVLGTVLHGDHLSSVSRTSAARVLAAVALVSPPGRSLVRRARVLPRGGDADRRAHRPYVARGVRAAGPPHP